MSALSEILGVVLYDGRASQVLGTAQPKKGL
jgi:hypothetical protein